MYCPKEDGKFDSKIHRVYHETIRQHGHQAKSARKPSLDDVDRRPVRYVPPRESELTW